MNYASQSATVGFAKPSPIYEVGLVKPATANFVRRLPRASSSPSASVGLVPTTRPIRRRLLRHRRTSSEPEAEGGCSPRLRFLERLEANQTNKHAQPSIRDRSLLERRHENYYGERCP